MPLLAKWPTPVLNHPDFQTAFNTRDAQDLCRAVETVLLPKTAVTLLEKTNFPHIIEIQTDAYPYEKNLYVDERFLKDTNEIGQPKSCPSHNLILAKLEECLGLPYVWGGNWPVEIPQMLEFYPSSLLRGVDCSGLLYYATDGFTPRNTTSLLSFGEEVKGELQPLDLLVWKGHVVCLLDETTCIESRLGQGVIKTPLEERLAELRELQQPFITRRFLPGQLID